MRLIRMFFASVLWSVAGLAFVIAALTIHEMLKQF